MIARKPQILMLSLAVAAALAACAKKEDAAPAADTAAKAPDALQLKLDESSLPGVNRFQIGDLDTSKNACTDFAGYANGKWLAANAIPSDRTSWGAFEMLDELEEGLASGPYLFGEQLTETDIRLFVTLVRFDAAYHGLFKANKRRIADYPNLSAYLHRLLEIPAFHDTVNIDHIKRGYYSVKALNPTGIVPLGPDGIALTGTGL